MTKIIACVLRLLGAMFCMLSLVSCSDNNRALNKYIEDIKARPAKPIEPLPAFLSVPQFKYPENANRRDPFKPLNVQKKNDSFAPNQNRKKQPLEYFPLDALKFVGTLEQGNIIWGLITQPGGQIIRVRPGDYMGQNYGKVLFIKESSIKIEETIKIQGKWEKQFIKLNLNIGKEGAS